MASYESFARVYDLFMSDTPYDDWCDYLHGLLLKYGVADGLVLELGCGTGAMTQRLARLGYDMIGVDNSIDMLEIAREKQPDIRNDLSDADMPDSAMPGGSKALDFAISGEWNVSMTSNVKEKESDILYLLQDMREFELYGTVRAVVSVCDSMNYITEEDDLLQVFRLVNNYLDPGGIFIFDLNTEYKYRELLSDNVFAENREEGSFIWENWYEEETGLNEYDLTLYIRKDSSDECYERYEETHIQRAWPIDCVCSLLAEAGLRLEAVYDAFTEDDPRQESERVYFVARETGKTWT
ncbi:MAG: class I SAM-dependent methyltransferase [Lachnospiraceae bacterium]|nr:class I SAM-dependent methyltransferase [Lachnospiraceae bacterium]MCD7767012.1 class I SAM-dependent methyltransferase [Lachnospiraceae bacterium]